MKTIKKIFLMIAFFILPFSYTHATATNFTKLINTIPLAVGSLLALKTAVKTTHELDARAVASTDYAASSEYRHTRKAMRISGSLIGTAALYTQFKVLSAVGAIILDYLP